MPLQDSDNFIVGRGNESYKITYQDLKDDLNYVPPPVGTIDKPTVLAPADGAGSGETRLVVTDAITAVEGGGIDVCETELIESVDTTTDAPNVILTFPSAEGFDCFEPGDVVQGVDTTEEYEIRSYNGSSLNPQAYNLATFVDKLPYDQITSVNATGSQLFYDLVVPIKFELVHVAGPLNDPGGTFYFYGSNNGNTWTLEATATHLNGANNYPHTRLTSATKYRYYMLRREDKGSPRAMGTDSYVPDVGAYKEPVKIISKDEDANTITVDGGAWKGSVSGESGDPADQEDKLTKETPYDTKLTLAGAKDLADLNVGDVVKMGMDADVPYQPVSDSIVTVTPDSPSAGQTTLTLSGDTDLAYFRPGDLVQDDRTWLQGDWTAVTTKSGGSSSTISRMFDGNYTTRFNSSGGAYGEVTTNLPVSAGDTLNVYAWSSATTSSFSIKFTFDDSSIVEWLGPFTSTPTLNVEKIVPVGATYIEKIRFTGTSSNGVGVAGITVNNLLLVDNGITGDPGVEVPILYINTDNNQMTVDGGNWAGTDGSGNGGWNQSQVWSSICTYVNGSTSRPLSLFFNGQLDQELYALSRKRATITFPSVVPATTGEIYGKINGATDSQWILEINGVEVTQGSDNDWTSIDTALAVEGGLKTISFGDNGSGTYPHIYGIKLDGKLLVDQGIAGAPIPGDPEVTCVSPLKAPTDWTIEGIDTDNNQLSLSHATPDDNAQVWVANDNQSGTDFYVTGPSIVDEPLLTADVELESSNFTTTPADSDTLKNIVWELNGVEQDAGTMNPYKPTLNTGTTYTVRVKHQGNTLEDSPWSDQTTFTTGASRNLYEYQRAQIQTLMTRIAELETDHMTLMDNNNNNSGGY